MYKDGIEVNQLSFQDGASPLAEVLVFFHDELMCILLITLVLVAWIMLSAMLNTSYCKYLVEGTAIEIIWTLIPTVVLLGIALPSLQLLYELGEIVEPTLTIKAVGHQWYWTYEYSDVEGESVEFDSYMIPTTDLEVGDLRLLEVDHRMVIPVNINVRIVVTGADVIHSFALPSLGVKVDAIPGRLNQLNFLIKRPGVYYGQCSEICGADHSFMPIVIEGVSQAKFMSWVCTHLAEIE